MLLRIYFHDFIVIQTASKTLFERDRSNSGNAKWYSGISEHETNSNPAWPKDQNQSSSTLTNLQTERNFLKSRASFVGSLDSFAFLKGIPPPIFTPSLIAAVGEKVNAAMMVIDL